MNQCIGSGQKCPNKIIDCSERGGYVPTDICKQTCNDDRDPESRTGAAACQSKCTDLLVEMQIEDEAAFDNFYDECYNKCMIKKCYYIYIYKKKNFHPIPSYVQISKSNKFDIFELKVILSIIISHQKNLSSL